MMRNFIGLLALVCLLLGFEAYAAEVTKVKGKSALVNLNGDPAAPGDVFYLVTSDGKRRALVRISKVKGDKAIAKITKGKAAVGMSLEPKGSSGGSSSGGGYASPSSSGGGSSKMYWGVLGGFAMDSMSVNVRNNVGASIGTENLAGNAFSAKGLFDYELFDRVWFRGTSGLEGFSASGASKCGVANNEACTANMYYISFDFLARYVFGSGNMKPWVGGGVGLLFPATKDSTALDSASISTTNVIIITGGVDWFLSPKMYIPLSVEYGMLPTSDEVKANWIAVRAGFAVPF